MSTKAPPRPWKKSLANDTNLFGRVEKRYAIHMVEALEKIVKFPCNCPPDGVKGECESCIARAVLAKVKQGGKELTR